MSEKYDEYLKEHKENVVKGFNWFKNNLAEILPYDENDLSELEHQICYTHDFSKSQPDEYEAYDEYFYGKSKSSYVVDEFNKAWLLHIHRNPHHWQYWVLQNDDPNNGEIVLEMPYNCIIEMICDWWSFSWKKGDLTEIFSWYDERKKYIKLAPNTRKYVEDIFEKMKKAFSDKITVVR